MKTLTYHSLLELTLGLVLSLLCAATLTCAAPVEPSSSSAGAGTNAVAAPIPAELRQSVFVMATNPKEGRNPFFPQSKMGGRSVGTNAPAVVDSTLFVLNGITSPPKRTAMINGYTFEVGEEQEIKLPNGTKAMVRCAEIKGETAVITFGGQRRELHLRFGI